ncbi:MAG: C45 family autoproteolytic acyltransferase/hydrolase [Desulfonatronovibrio sp.]
MKKYFVYPCLLMLYLALFVLTSCGGGNSDQNEYRIFEQGRAEPTETGKYWVVDLTGSWMEMGRQYGGLMGPELRNFHAQVVEDLRTRGVSQEDMIAVAKEIYALYSWELQDVILGISQTSGLSMDETMVLNAGMILLTIAVLEGEPPSACSGIAVWNEYSMDGRLIFGRNWDIDRKAMRDYMRYLAVVIFHPQEGHAFANIHPLGNVYMETGMNSEGLFIELNNAEYSDSAMYEDREDTSSVLVRVLNQSENVAQAVYMLKNIPADISYILQIADPSRAVSLERPTFDARVRDLEDDGLVITYNSFVPPYPAHWEGKVNPPKPAENDPRYENMLQLAQSPAYKGMFTPKTMQDYLEVPIEEGGAYHPRTVIQVVSVPAERTIWMRGCDYTDWERVPLADYFYGVNSSY